MIEVRLELVFEILDELKRLEKITQTPIMAKELLCDLIHEEIERRR